MNVPVSRDRRDRGPIGPLVPQSVPAFRSRRALFDAAVLAAYAPLASRFSAQLVGLDVAVDTVPRMRLDPDMTVLPPEIVADGPVPLGRVIPAGVSSQGTPTRARIVVFRMPIEQRSTPGEERHRLLTAVFTALVAYYLNLDPRDLDPDYPW